MANHDKQNRSLQHMALANHWKPDSGRGTDSVLAHHAIGDWVVAEVKWLNQTVFIVWNLTTGWFLRPIANTIDD
jgi:hypothetical protein